MKPLRIAYQMMHGATRMLVKIHQELLDRGLAEGPPNVILFNRYWRNLVMSEFPNAQTTYHPDYLDFWRRKGSTNQVQVTDNESFFLRAWKIDRVLREKSEPMARWIWDETLRRVDGFFEKSKPDVVISEIIQSLPCYAIFFVACRRKIPFIQLTSSRLGGTRLELHNDISGAPCGIRDIPKQEEIQWAENYLTALAERKSPIPGYLQYYKNKKITIRWEDVLKSVRYLRELALGGGWEVSRGPVLMPFTSKFRSFLTRRRLKDHHLYKTVKDAAAFKERKLLFPLHVTPEASTLTWAPAYISMGDTLSRLSDNLPKGWILLAKEHPSVTTVQRSVDELRQIQGLKNVVLLGPYEQNEDLINLCEGVVTVNSTLGMEALLMEKPVITLGNPFYDLTGNTIICRDLKTFPEAVARLQAHSVSRERNRLFLAAYHQLSGDGIYANPDLFNAAYTKNLMSAANIRQIGNFLSAMLFQRYDTLRADVTESRIKTL